MAISSLPTGGEEEGGIVAEINITPLTDIFLVLLIIFMVTTTVVEEEGKNIELPTATESDETPKGVTVAVELDGTMYLNEKVVPAGSLFTMLEREIEAAEQKIVILKGDRRVLLGQAVSILDTAQQAGAESVAIQTEQPVEEED